MYKCLKNLYISKNMVSNDKMFLLMQYFIFQLIPHHALDYVYVHLLCRFIRYKISCRTCLFSRSFRAHILVGVMISYNVTRHRKRMTMKLKLGMRSLQLHNIMGIYIYIYIYYSHS